MDDRGYFSKLILATTLIFSILGHAKPGPTVPGEFIIKLKSHSPAAQKNFLQHALGGIIAKNFPNAGQLVLLKRPSVETEVYSLHQLSKNDLVEYVEPNYTYRSLAGVADLPNDPLFDKQWSLVNGGNETSGESGTVQAVAGVDIGARRAWPLEVSTKGILVAILDSGLLYNHADLVLSVHKNSVERNGKPGVDDDGNGVADDIYGYDFSNTDSDPLDDLGHGTHITSIVGARGNNSIGMVGVSWNASILPIKVLDSSGYSDTRATVSGIDYAIKMGARIINISWGGASAYSQAMYDALERAKAAGVLVVAAAGNSGSDNDTSPEYPASYPIDNIISVASIGPGGKLDERSNFGHTSVHLAAPGMNIPGYTLTGVENKSGTSMAAPHVSAAGALLWSQERTQSYLQIKQRILNGIQPIGRLQSRVMSGGMLNVYLALTDQKGGHDPSDPYAWSRQAQTVSTAHPYGDEVSQSWTFHVPGATSLAIHFSSFETEESYDNVNFTDSEGTTYATYTGGLGEGFSPVFKGDTVVMTFTTDGSVVKNGFDIDYISYR